MENEKMCFTQVEFVDDPNVVGLYYWYLCEDESVLKGERVVAPLGRHNNMQEGVVRSVRFSDERSAPYPVNLIKRIKKVIKENADVSDSKKA